MCFGSVVVLWVVGVLNLDKHNGKILTARLFLPLQINHVEMPPETEEAILALRLALPVGDRNLTKEAKYFKFCLCLLIWLSTLDLP